jgi:hypothetical protein
VYDVMEAKGIFRSNPYNLGAVDPVSKEPIYKGPAQFPMVVYHPKGKERETTKPELMNTPFGPQAVGGQRVMISKIVKNEEELSAAIAEGWHEHPADAIEARNATLPEDERIPVPPKSSAVELDKLRRDKSDLEARLARAEAALAAQRARGDADEDEE